MTMICYGDVPISNALQGCLFLCLCFATLLLQGVEDHVEHVFLSRLVLIEYGKAFPHGKPSMQIIGVPAGKYDDPLPADPFFGGIGEEFSSVQAGHFEIEKEQVEVGRDVGKPPYRIVAGIYFEVRVALPDIGRQKFEKRPVVVYNQYFLQPVFPFRRLNW